MLCLPMGGGVGKVIREGEHGGTSIFTFFKGIKQNSLYL